MAVRSPTHGARGQRHEPSAPAAAEYRSRELPRDRALCCRVLSAAVGELDTRRPGRSDPLARCGGRRRTAAASCLLGAGLFAFLAARFSSEPCRCSVSSVAAPRRTGVGRLRSLRASASAVCVPWSASPRHQPRRSAPCLLAFRHRFWRACMRALPRPRSGCRSASSAQPAARHVRLNDSWTSFCFRRSARRGGFLFRSTRASNSVFLFAFGFFDFFLLLRPRSRSTRQRHVSSKSASRRFILPTLSSERSDSLSSRSSPDPHRVLRRRPAIAAPGPGTRLAAAFDRLDRQHPATWHAPIEFPVSVGGLQGSGRLLLCRLMF